MITQEECIDKLRDEGYRVKVRTLTYWRSEKLLPPLIRIGTQYLWDENVSEQVKVLCDRTSSKVLFKFGPYGITKAEFVRVGEELRRAMYTNERSVLVRKLKEEIVDAVTKG